MYTYQILFFVFAAACTVAGIIGGWLEDRYNYRKQIRQLQRENATLRGKLNAKEYNYNEQMQSR